MQEFKEFSRTETEVLRSTKLTFTAHASIHEEPKMPETKHILAYPEFSSTIFFKLSFGDFFKLFSVFFAASN